MYLSVWQHPHFGPPCLLISGRWLFSASPKNIFLLLFRQAYGVLLTPSDEEENPLPQLVCRVGHDDGRVQVAAFYKHPEEIGHHKVVEDGCDAPAPQLEREAEGKHR